MYEVYIDTAVFKCIIIVIQQSVVYSRQSFRRAAQLTAVFQRILLYDSLIIHCCTGIHEVQSILYSSFP